MIGVAPGYGSALMRGAALIFASGAFFAALPVAAQVSEITLECSAFTREPPLPPVEAKLPADEAKPPQDEVKVLPNLFVACNKIGFALGSVEQYRLYTRPELGATLVDTTIYGDRRIWLIVHDAKSGPYLENISGSIASAAGRRGSSNLADISIDLSVLDALGTIALTSTAEGLRRSASFDLKGVVARSREVRAAAVRTNQQQ